MFPRSLSRCEVRDVDRRAIEDFGLPGIVLMENAGRGAAELLISLGIAGPVVVVAGKGNNGGDGFVIARHLDNHGVDVRILLCCLPEELSGEAAINFHVLVCAGFRIAVLDPDLQLAELASSFGHSDWIVDALLGTGAQRPLREPFVSVIHAINASRRRIFAVDLPSGLDCDTGLPLGDAVRAEHTATFVARKIGFDVPAAREFTGEVHVVDIGVPRALFANRADQ